MNLQFLMDDPERVAADDDVTGPIGRKHQHGRLLLASRKARQNVQGCVITPMQIFNYDDPRPVRTQDLEELPELTQHSLPSGPEDLALQGGAISCAKETRHLGQPGWSMIVKRSEQEGSIRAATTLLQRFDKWEKSFIGPKMLDAAAQ